MHVKYMQMNFQLNILGILVFQLNILGIERTICMILYGKVF